jgi:hypothetical protein
MRPRVKRGGSRAGLPDAQPAVAAGTIAPDHLGQFRGGGGQVNLFARQAVEQRLHKLSQ